MTHPILVNRDLTVDFRGLKKVKLFCKVIFSLESKIDAHTLPFILFVGFIAHECNVLR